LATACITEAVVRLVPGVLKKEEATQLESFFEVSIDRLIESVGKTELLQGLKKKNIQKVTLLEYPHYTRPEIFRGKKVPPVIVSGNHKDIENWRIKRSYEETLKRRPDLLK